ncbi:hypothetical protein RAM_29290 [Amycolatopsis mediterranei S699]|uniref:Uncharacterized protein n=1 Tax=Amycolatopsis mediterranei (strain S699) TaxID=713604 RepID=A0A9R0P164_AMYMS|nr:hypothetical protein RAM_29290 [Amycolatopsis mediterranei S699]
MTARTADDLVVNPGRDGELSVGSVLYYVGNGRNRR